MDIDWLDDEVILYPTEEELNSLLVGEYVTDKKDISDRFNEEEYVYIDIQAPFRRNMTRGRYEDSLRALKESYKLIQQLKNKEIEIENVDLRAIESTYLYFEKQQEKYR